MPKPAYNLPYAAAHCALSARLKRELRQTWEQTPETARKRLVRDFVHSFNRTQEKVAPAAGPASALTQACQAGRLVLSRYASPDHRQTAHEARPQAFSRPGHGLGSAQRETLQNGL